MNQLLTKRQIAESMAVSTRTIEAYMRQGLPYLKISPGTVRFDPHAVAAWTAKRNQALTPAS